MIRSSDEGDDVGSTVVSLVFKTNHNLKHIACMK